MPPVVHMNPMDVISVNEPNQLHLNKVLVSLRDGWNGRPLLVVVSPYGKVYALTGSHRIAAARRLGINVPVLIFDWRKYEGWHWVDRELTYKTNLLVGDDDDILRAITESGPIFAKKLMQQEVASNVLGWS